MAQDARVLPPASQESGKMNAKPKDSLLAKL